MPDVINNVTNKESQNIGQKALEMHLFDRKYHKFSKRSKGLKVTTLSLCHFATISPRGVRVEANLDNVTNYTIF